MTEAHQDVEGAAEQMEALIERAHDWPGDAAIAAHVSVGDVKAMRALLTDWRRLKAEKKAIEQHACRVIARSETALSETRAVLKEVVEALEAARDRLDDIQHDEGIDLGADVADCNTALTRAAELEKRNG